MDYKIVKALKFWSVNSYEHIQALQVLGVFFSMELTTLFGMFKNIDESLVYNEVPVNLDELCEAFERANRAFVRLLDSMKFNNTSDIDTIQLIICDQLRAKQSLDSLYNAKYISVKSLCNF